jgi:hypothetical protein
MDPRGQQCRWNLYPPTVWAPTSVSVPSDLNTRALQLLGRRGVRAVVEAAADRDAPRGTRSAAVATALRAAIQDASGGWLD